MSIDLSISVESLNNFFNQIRDTLLLIALKTINWNRKKLEKVFSSFLHHHCEGLQEGMIIKYVSQNFAWLKCRQQCCAKIAPQLWSYGKWMSLWGFKKIYNFTWRFLCTTLQSPVRRDRSSDRLVGEEKVIRNILKSNKNIIDLFFSLVRLRVTLISCCVIN